MKKAPPEVSADVSAIVERMTGNFVVIRTEVYLEIRRFAAATGRDVDDVVREVLALGLIAIAEKAMGAKE